MLLHYTLIQFAILCNHAICCHVCVTINTHPLRLVAITATPYMLSEFSLSKIQMGQPKTHLNQM